MGGNHDKVAKNKPPEVKPSLSYCSSDKKPDTCIAQFAAWSCEGTRESVVSYQKCPPNSNECRAPESSEDENPNAYGLPFNLSFDTASVSFSIENWVFIQVRTQYWVNITNNNLGIKRNPFLHKPLHEGKKDLRKTGFLLILNPLKLTQRCVWTGTVYERRYEKILFYLTRLMSTIKHVKEVQVREKTRKTGKTGRGE